MVVNFSTGFELVESFVVHDKIPMQARHKIARENKNTSELNKKSNAIKKRKASQTFLLGTCKTDILLKAK